MREQTKQKLIGAMRQYRHNTDNSGSISNPEKGFVSAYDRDEIHDLVIGLERKLERTLPFNNLTPAEAERLHYLIEECGEVIQAAGKVLRHGYKCTHPDGGPTNREQLTKELGQLSVAMRMMWLRGDYNWQALCDAQEAKYVEIDKYLHHNHFRLGELRRGQ